MNKKEILIIGKSGAGKSSFINYMFDSYECEAGEGKPVTPKGIFRKKYTKDYYLYDTWGLEADKFPEWKKMLENALNNIESPNIDLPQKGFFDSIFYCISAKNARLETKEIEIIKLLYKNKENPIIILTKCNIASSEEIKELKKELLKNIDQNLKIAEVASIEEETFSGKIEKFGKEEVEKFIYIGYINKLVNFVPNFIQREILKELNKEKEYISKKINSKKYDVNSYNEELTKIIQEAIPQKAEVIIKNILESYNINNNLNLKNNDFSNITGLRVVSSLIIVTLDFLTSPLIPVTAAALFIDKLMLSKRLTSHLNETFKNFESEIGKFPEKIKNEILEKVSSIVICSNCNTKLKVSLNSNNRCPKCKNIEKIKDYYN